MLRLLFYKSIYILPRTEAQSDAGTCLLLRSALKILQTHMLHGKIGREDTGTCLCAVKKHTFNLAREQAHALFARLMQLAPVAAGTRLQVAAQVIHPKEMDRLEYPAANDVHRMR